MIHGIWRLCEEKDLVRKAVQKVTNADRFPSMQTVLLYYHSAIHRGSLMHGFRVIIAAFPICVRPFFR